MEDYFKPDKRWEIHRFKSQEEYAKKVVIKGYFHDQVPKDVIQAFTTVEYLMAHAYYHWPMFDEALKKCLFTLEMAIKLKAEQEGIAIMRKKKNGGTWHRPLNKIVKDICRKDHLSLFKQYLDRARELRNTIAHPNSYGFMGPNGSDRYIKHLINVINTLFLDESTYINDVRKVRKASKHLSRISGGHQLFLKKGKSGHGYLVYELLDLEVFAETTLLIIHPYPTKERIDKDDFICNDPLVIEFKEIEYKKDRAVGLSINGEILELCQINNDEFTDYKDAYKNHLSNLSKTDSIVSLTFWNYQTSWQLVAKEYEYNKMRYG